MITIDIIALVNRILSFVSGLSLGGLIRRLVYTRDFSRE